MILCQRASCQRCSRSVPADTTMTALGMKSNGMRMCFRGLSTTRKSGREPLIRSRLIDCRPVLLIFVMRRTTFGMFYCRHISVQIFILTFIFRPEALESVFIMYRITGDKTLLDTAWRMFQNIDKATRS